MFAFFFFSFFFKETQVSFVVLILACLFKSGRAE